ncbi:MAG: hypothetical protein ACP5DC_03855 [Halothiobacillaceae bacterium]
MIRDNKRPAASAFRCRLPLLALPGLLLLGLAPGLGLPVSAQPATLPDADQLVFESLARLNHQKQDAVLKRLGIEVPENFYNCLCANAGYGSPQTARYFHPGPIPDSSPSCESAGPPCIVAGFGCLRHPLPDKRPVWERCASREQVAGRGNPLDEVFDRVTAERQVSPDDERQYAQCQQAFKSQRERMNEATVLDGLTYLANQGVPIIKAPPSIRKMLQAEEERAGRTSADLREAERKKAEASLPAALAKKIRDSKETYSSAVAVASQLAETRLAEVNARLTEIERIKKDPALSVAPSQATTDAQRAAVAHRRALETEKASLKTQQDRHRKALADLGRLQTVITAGADAFKIEGELKKLFGRELAGQVSGAVEIMDTAKRYLDTYVAGQDAALDALIDKHAPLHAIYQNADVAQVRAQGQKLARLQMGQEIFGGVIFAGKKSLEAHAYYKKMLEIVAESERMAQSGKYTEASARLISGFNHLGHLGRSAAPYLPGGAREILQYYSEAMDTPGKVAKMMQEAVDRADVAAEIVGSQAKAAAMKRAADEVGSLNRDPYLFRDAGLSVYDVDYVRKTFPDADEKITHVAIPDQNADPVYLSAAQYRRLQEYAWYWPIAHGTSMTDADVMQNFGNIGKAGLPPIDDIERLARENLEAAAMNQIIAEALGKKTVSFEDTQAYWDFQELMRKHLPEGCTLDTATQKKLLASWQEAPESEGRAAAVWRNLMGAPAPNDGKAAVESFLSAFGSRMHGARVRQLGKVSTNADLPVQGTDALPHNGVSH